MSASIIPTFLPSVLKAYAKFAATVDFPTPPLPEAIPIYLISLAKILSLFLFNSNSALIPVKPKSNLINLANDLVTVLL